MKINLKSVLISSAFILLAGASHAGNTQPAAPIVGEYRMADGQCQKTIQTGISSVECDNLVLFQYADYAAGPSYRYLAESQACVLLVDSEGHPQCNAKKSTDSDGDGDSNPGLK
jgi:hypothetical protein